MLQCNILFGGYFMADPVSLSLLAGGVGLGAVSSIASGYTAAANARAQQYGLESTAKGLENQATNAMSQANEQSNAQQREAKQAAGLQRAATAQSGLGFEGTGSDLIDQSAAAAELDRQNILYGGLLTAQNLQSQADQANYAADFAASQAIPAIIGGYMSAGSNVLSGSGLAKKYGAF